MFTIQIDPTELTARLPQVARDQLPYATAYALNLAADAAQEGVRRQAERVLVLRSRAWMLRLIKRRRGLKGYGGAGDDFASKTKLAATVRIEGPEGDERRGVVLWRHLSDVTAGGTRTMDAGDTADMLRGRFPFYLPTGALRPSPASVVPRAMYPRALRLAPRMTPSGVLEASRRGQVRTVEGRRIGARARAERQLQGIGGTFVIRASNTESASNAKAWGVWQRVAKGTGPGAIRMIWALRRSIEVPTRFSFRDSAAQAFGEAWPTAFLLGWDRALRTSGKPHAR